MTLLAACGNEQTSTITLTKYDGATGIIYAMNPDGSSIMSVPVSGGEPTVLNQGTKWSLLPHVSPDGTRIAFTSDADGNYEISTMAIDGSDVRQLRFTDPPIQHVGPKNSPDGSLLLYATDEDEADPATQQNIWSIPSDGGPAMRLTSTINSRESRGWSPDGEWIAFASNHEGNYDIYRVRPDGSELTRITESPEQELSVGWGPLK